jgi:hypothetical protein
MNAEVTSRLQGANLCPDIAQHRNPKNDNSSRFSYPPPSRPAFMACLGRRIESKRQNKKLCIQKMEYWLAIARFPFLPSALKGLAPCLPGSKFFAPLSSRFPNQLPFLSFAFHLLDKPLTKLLELCYSQQFHEELWLKGNKY